MKHQFVYTTMLMAVVTGALGATISTNKAPSSMAKTNDLTIVNSVYEPVKLRDPFGSQVAAGTTSTAKPVAVFTGLFQLQGILSSGADSSAIINDKLVTLNKSTTINAGGTEVQIKAVEIGRDRVVLEVGGQKVELRLKTGTGTESQPGP